MDPRPGQIVTVFRSRLSSDGSTDYYEHAARMGELARSMPGYVEHKIFVAEDGERLTLVTFADRASQENWRDHPEHLAAQRAGMQQYYDTYRISVSTVEHVSSFDRKGRSEPAGLSNSAGDGGELGG